jgi:osmoprotectant transport system substrate-binding protein
VLSSAGGIAAGSLVVLRDDKLLQPAGNILALYRSDLPAAARAVVDSVNRALTTEKLQELNKRQDLDGQDPDGLAKRFLQDAKLL